MYLDIDLYMCQYFNFHVYYLLTTKPMASIYLQIVYIEVYIYSSIYSIYSIHTTIYTIYTIPMGEFCQQSIDFADDSWYR